MNSAALEQPDCPLCGAAGRTRTRRAGRELRRCTACAFAWIPQGLARGASGRSIYEDDISHFDDYADYYQDESTSEAAEEKLEWVRANSPGGGRLLDVGANFGYFAAEAARAFDVTGIEPGAALVAWGQAHLQAPIRVGSVYDDEPEFAGRFDVITAFDVLEHVPDPRGALDQCARYLAPGGRFYLTTPNTESVMARVLGVHWYYVDIIQHIALFGETNLRRLLAERGFRVVSKRTFGRRYRFSYIERRLRELSAEASILKIAHFFSKALLVRPGARIPLDLGDVMGLVVERS